MKRNFLVFVIASLLADAGSGFGQGLEPAASQQRIRSPAARTALLTLGINATVATVSYFAFWQGQSHSFHFKDDGWFDRHQYALGADKIGHSWSAYQLTNFSAWAYKQLGVSDSWANLGGMLNAQLALLIMEIGDGMTPWGFSREDVISNAAGALFAYSRLRWPLIQDLTDYKLTYVFRYPAPLLGTPQRAGFFENYDDMTYWLVLRGKRILPGRLNFLGLAVGYHIEGYHFKRPRQRVWLVGLDLDWSELLRTKKPLLQGLVSVFNIYHLPFLPAWKETTHPQ